MHEDIDRGNTGGQQHQECEHREEQVNKITYVPIDDALDAGFFADPGPNRYSQKL
jgi:hypothetical protein